MGEGRNAPPHILLGSSAPAHPFPTTHISSVTTYPELGTATSQLVLFIYLFIIGGYPFITLALDGRGWGGVKQILTFGNKREVSEMLTVTC